MGDKEALVTKATNLGYVCDLGLLQAFAFILQIVKMFPQLSPILRQSRPPSSLCGSDGIYFPSSGC